MTILDLSSITRQYGALRPLRIERLTVHAGEQVAVIGLDQPAAEVFISLVTGAALPDAGTVDVFGRRTTEIADSDDWLATLDRFGIVSDRAALIDQFSVAQNLSVPYSLDIEPPPPDVYAKAAALAAEAGLGTDTLDRAVGLLSAEERLRIRFARALALEPSLLLFEHPSASLDGVPPATIAAHFRAALERRGVASITLTMDRDYARAAAARVLILEPSSGKLTELNTRKFKFWS